MASLPTSSRSRESKITSETSHMDLESTSLMCYHCFDTMINNYRISYPQLSSIVQIPPPNTDLMDNGKPLFFRDLPKEDVSCPLFVTWEKKKKGAAARSNLLSFGGRGGGIRGSHHRDESRVTDVYELRGCIGTLSPLPVATALTKYAVLSALQDQRFSPIQPSELPLLRVAVSLLVKYEPCQHAYDWDVGKHGIIIQFNPGMYSKSFSATYLPEVAKEQKWDQATTVTSLIRKAGYTQPITQRLIDNIQCTRYQSSKLKMTFDEFLEMARQFNPTMEGQMSMSKNANYSKNYLQHHYQQRPTQEVNQSGCNIL